MLFSTDSRGLDHWNFLQQLRKYEFVTPQLHAHGRWKRETSTQTNSVSDEPIPYSDIHSVCAISQLFPLTVVYFASMNRIFFCGHIACICKNWFVNWRHHAVFNEKQYVKLTLRLGWSFGKNTFVLKGIWQRLHLGRRSKPVSRALKLPHSFYWVLVRHSAWLHDFIIMQYCSCFSRILLSGTYLSRYFDENGNEIVEKNEVSLYIFVFNEALFFLVTCLCSRDNLLAFCLSKIDNRSMSNICISLFAV